MNPSLVQQFQSVDADNDGQITKAELAQVLNISEDEAESMIEDVSGAFTLMSCWLLRCAETLHNRPTRMATENSTFSSLSPSCRACRNEHAERQTHILPQYRDTSTSSSPPPPPPLLQSLLDANTLFFTQL